MKDKMFIVIMLRLGIYFSAVESDLYGIFMKKFLQNTYIIEIRPREHDPMKKHFNFKIDSIVWKFDFRLIQ